MRAFTFILTLLLFTTAAQAQNTITVNSSAEVLVPADEIIFRINLNAEAETSQEAYILHQDQEKTLVQLLKKYEIAEKDIDFKPIRISRVDERRYNSSGKKFVRTRQAVTLSLDNFDVYEKIQITLIDNGFDNFSGRFSSSASTEGKDEALKKALKIAREKANIIASQTGVTISGIKDITHSYNHGQPGPVMEMAATRAMDSLMEYEQAVSVSANVTVTYTFDQ